MKEKNNTQDNVKETVIAFKAQLVATANDPVNRSARIMAFAHKNEQNRHIIRHPLTHDAYTKRLRDFKYLLGIVKGLPLDDLPTITNKLSGSFRLPHHLYLHHCLPDYSGKEEILEKHRTNEGANKVMNNILSEVEELLDQGKVGDREYAARLLDDMRLIAFATDWLQTAKLHD